MILSKFIQTCYECKFWHECKTCDVLLDIIFEANVDIFKECEKFEDCNGRDDIYSIGFFTRHILGIALSPASEKFMVECCDKRRKGRI